MKRRRLVGKQSAHRVRNGGCVPDYSVLEVVWLRGFASDIPRFLEPEDWCKLEGASRFWQECAVGTPPWRDLYVDRFGSPTWQMMGNRADWKIRYFHAVSFRIVPGERAAGIRIGHETRELRTKPCDVVVPRYHISDYLSPGQGYRYLDFKFPGGPVKPLESWDRQERGLRSMDVIAAFEEGPTDTMTPCYDFPDTDFTGQWLTIWTGGSLPTVNAIGVHYPFLGALEVRDRPELKGICVGIPFQKLLELLGASIEDICFCGSNPGGPKVWFEQLERVCFEVDAENGGLAEVDDFTCYQDIDWLKPRLHHPIRAIFIW